MLRWGETLSPRPFSLHNVPSKIGRESLSMMQLLFPPPPILFRGKGGYFLLLLFFLAACNPFKDDEEQPWIYAETPVPPIDERGGKPLVMVVGDSIAAGWQMCNVTPCKGIELDWWQAALGEAAIVLNRGIGNSTTDDLLDRWDQDTKDAEIIIILVGVNDIARGKNAAHILKNLEKMHERAVKAGAIPVFVTVMPADTTDTPQKLAVMQEVNTTLRQKRDWLIMDLSQFMEDPASPGHLRRTDVAFEGSAHPNEQGYQKMAAFVKTWWMGRQSALGN